MKNIDPKVVYKDVNTKTKDYFANISATSLVQTHLDWKEYIEQVYPMGNYFRFPYDDTANSGDVLWMSSDGVYNWGSAKEIKAGEVYGASLGSQLTGPQKEVNEKLNGLNSNYIWTDELEDEADVVNSPAHYNHNRLGIECIKAIEASMTPEQFIGYIKGNVIKYNWRFEYKNGVEDLEKAKWYQALLIEKYKEYEDEA